MLRCSGFALALCGFAAISSAEAPWVEVKAPHFTVVSNDSEKAARRIARQFEEVHAVFQKHWPWAKADPTRPVIVLAARDENTLKALLPAHTMSRCATSSSQGRRGIRRQHQALPIAGRYRLRCPDTAPDPALRPAGLGLVRSSRRDPSERS